MLAGEEMALTGVGSCGSFGDAAMDGADKRGRASWIDDAIKDFKVLSWSGVKHPGRDWTVEG